MRFKSVSSVNTDAYRAGAEIGRSLHDIHPEVVLLFASITYEEEFSVFHEGLYDELDSSSVIVFGGTGDGIYETDRAVDYGVSALGINSGGTVAWSVALELGTQNDSYAAARNCALKLNAPDATFAFLIADGMRADGKKIAQGAADVLKIPFFGGLTGDDRNFTRSRLLLNGRVLEDAVAILAGTGPLLYSVNAFSGWTPIGATGQVQEAQGTIVRKINGMSAQAFIKKQLGKPFGEKDIGTIPLATYQQGDDTHFLLRTTHSFDPATGGVAMFGSVEEGTPVRICTANRQDIIKGVKKAIEGIGKDFTPSAAIVISCAGRKWILQDCGREEIDLIFETLGRRVPLAGFPSFGEISPFRKPGGSYTATFFHNVTFVICLIGEAS